MTSLSSLSAPPPLPVSRLRLAWLPPVIAVFAFLAALAFGSVVLSFSDLLAAFLAGPNQDSTHALILWELRLPRALTAAFSGAALALAGLQLQTLLRNPLADPYILGVSSGAALGVAFVVLAGGTAVGLFGSLAWPGRFSVVGAASLGAVGVTLLLLTLARRVDVFTLLVCGVMIGALASAAVSVLVVFAAPTQVQSFILWSYGNFGRVTWADLRLILPLLSFGLASGLLLAKPANALLLGETTAATLGVHVARLRWFIVALSALLVGVVTAFCGPIAFIGVAMPHLCRGLLRTSDHRHLGPACVTGGAALALLADLVARLPGQAAVLPLSAVTALVGAPVVLTVLWRARREARE